ncbi:MAG: hypothetical protein RIS73_903, partial [Bacteroidota bacterium]
MMDNQISKEAVALFKNAVDILQPLPDNDFERLTNVLKYKKYNK